LLRQYLRLGGKLLGFNWDLQFGDVVEGLIIVDLAKTNPRVLEPYMGKRGITTFLAHQQPSLLQQVSCGIEDVLGG
jgi:hypothetical protein